MSFSFSEIIKIPERTGYKIKRNYRCQKSYGGDSLTFNEAKKHCAFDDCLHIENDDCRQEKGFKVCFPGMQLASINFNPHSCVYEAQGEGNIMKY